MGRKTAERSLTHTAVENLKTPGMHPVGEVTGLYVQVLKSGSKTWVLRYMLDGRRRDMGLGGFPSVKLAGAKERARAARELLAKGIDPVDQRDEERRLHAEERAAKAQREVEKPPTFREAAEQYIAVFDRTWKNRKHAAQWPSSLEAYAYPYIGDVAVHEVRAIDVRKLLERIWTTKTETAKRVQGRIEMVLDRARAVDAESERPTFPQHWQNPARWKKHLDGLLPRPTQVRAVENYPALPYERIGAFMQDLRARSGAGARCLEFCILTASRSGAARGARWAEIDLDRKMWTVPAARMKGRRGLAREHRVPLPQAALDLLDALPRMAGTDLIFPAALGGELSDATLGAVVKRMNEPVEAWVDKHGVPVVPHGFRSTFKDWATERTSFPNEMSEVALAHKLADKTEAAYRRGDMVEKRRKMMEAWATYIAKVEQAKGARVQQLRGDEMAR